MITSGHLPSATETNGSANVESIAPVPAIANGKSMAGDEAAKELTNEDAVIVQHDDRPVSASIAPAEMEKDASFERKMTVDDTPFDEGSSGD
jgi:hypothetical protein